MYDIYFPRVPSTDEIEEVIKEVFQKVDKNKLWINPDCGLKTREVVETKEGLRNLVEATKNMRIIIE